MSAKHTIKVRVVRADGTVSKVRVKLPKRYRKNRLDEWRGLTDAYAAGLADGLAQQITRH